MEYRKTSNHKSYNINHFVNESIDSLQQEVIKVRQTAWTLCYVVIEFTRMVKTSVLLQSNIRFDNYLVKN